MRLLMTVSSVISNHKLKNIFLSNMAPLYPVHCISMRISFMLLTTAKSIKWILMLNYFVLVTVMRIAESIGALSFGIKSRGCI